MNQQSSQQSKNFIQSITNQIKNHKNTIALGIGMGALIFGLKFFSSRLHPDIRKVLKLKQIIQLSQPLSLKALQNLKVQKTIETTYGKSQQNISHNNEINMQFLLITKLKLKQANKQQQLRNPFLPPFQQGIFISQLQPSHRLIYNKFNIYQNHLIVITKQFQSQNNQLNEQDFKQTILTVKALDGLLFFNCGKDSGSSQPHKHIQVFPKQALQLPIIKQIALFVQNLKENNKNLKDKMFQFPGFNFIHGLIVLQPKVSITQSKKAMYKAYKLILEQTVKKIRVSAYNVIGTQSFIMGIPRRKQRAFNQIAINSVGFMGSILFKDEEKLNKYLSLKIKPSSILEDITYPKDYQSKSQIQQQVVEQKPQLKQ